VTTLTLQSYEVDEVTDSLLEFRRMLRDAGHSQDDEPLAGVDRALSALGYYEDEVEVDDE
jgi:hypothetical protein